MDKEPRLTSLTICRGPLTRRAFLGKMTCVLGGLAAGGSLLTSCASPSAPGQPTSQPTSKPQATSAPAVASPKPAATSAPAPAQTQAPTSKIQRGGVLRDAERLQSDSLDPHLASNRESAYWSMLFDTLLLYRVVDPDPQKPKFEIKPGLAESYKVTNGNIFEFKLRKGVKFHDGSDFNANVAKWNLDRVMQHPKSQVKDTLRNVTEVKVVDDYTLTVTLKGPSPIFPLQVSQANLNMVPMISKEAVEKMGDDKFASNPVGTGPFKFKEWKRDDRIVLEKYPGHWEKGADGQPMPYLDGYVGRFMTDAAVAFLELRSGNLDSFSFIGLKDVAAAQAMPELKVSRYPGAYRAFPNLYINPRPTSQSPFSKDKRLREACQYALDRESMAKTLGFGLGEAHYYSFFFPGVLGYDETLPRRQFDLAKAKQLLADAGYANGIDIEIKVINRTDEKRAVEVVQAMWAKAGIRAKIVVLDRLPWIDDCDAGKFEALAHGMTSRADHHLARDAMTDAELNSSGYSRKEVDDLYEQAGREYDDAKRADIYKQIQRYLYEDAYHIIGYRFPLVAGLGKKVNDFTNLYSYRYVWMEK